MRRSTAILLSALALAQTLARSPESAPDAREDATLVIREGLEGLLRSIVKETPELKSEERIIRDPRATMIQRVDAWKRLSIEAVP